MLKRILVSMSFLVTAAIVFSTIIASPSTAKAEDMFAMVGFATQNGGTTGGTRGTEVIATSVSQVNSLLSTRRKNSDTSPLIIKFASKIKGTEAIAAKEVSNITFLGIGTSGELEGVGINLVRSNNIIIRNLKIHHTLAPMDGIGIENTKNVWVDHCEIYNMIGDCNGDGKVDTKGDISGGDIDWYDGLLDVKADSAYITVSWTYFHDAYKTSLVGSSDSDTYDRKITFHHNIYSNTKSRLPSYRGGTGHMFNNYYVNADGSGINSRMGAKLRIENNVFENVGSGSMDGSGFAEGPIGSYYSNSIGYWDVSNNIFTNCKGNQPTTSTCSFTPPYTYSNVLHPVNQVKSIVTQYAGVGKIDASSTPIVMPTFAVTPTKAQIQTPTATISGDIVYGDLNDDRNVNSIDFAMLRVYLLGSGTFSDNQRKAADLNLDGNVNSIDFACLRQYLLGMINNLPYNADAKTPTPISTPTQTISPTQTSQSMSGDIIIEPNGTTTLQQAINSIQPGKTIYLKSGTYKYSSTILIAEGNNGTSGAMKTIAAYGTDKPVLDFSDMAWGSSNRGIVMAANYWKIKGIKIQYAGDNGILLSGHYNTIDNCEFYANGDTGLQLSRYNSSYTTIDKWPSNNTIVDCYSHSNYDEDNGEDADGFAAKLTCGQNNKFIRCVSKYNVDDGWDLYTKDDTGPIGSVYFEDCEASYNGKTESGQYTADSDGNGFKLGGSKISVDHKLVNCRAYNNKKHGFTWNSNPGNLVLIGCQASGNGGNNFEKVANQ